MVVRYRIPNKYFGLQVRQRTLVDNAVNYCDGRDFRRPERSVSALRRRPTHPFHRPTRTVINDNGQQQRPSSYLIRLMEAWEFRLSKRSFFCSKTRRVMAVKRKRKSVRDRDARLERPRDKKTFFGN